MRKTFVLSAMCVLVLFGTVMAAAAADAMPEQQPENGAIKLDTAAAGINFQVIGDKLEQMYIPRGMDLLGRFNVTIDPDETFEVQPINTEYPVEVDRDTPIGALDAVAGASDQIEYIPYYYDSYDFIVIDGINEYEYQAEPFATWFVLYQENQTYSSLVMNASSSHTLSDEEIIWFIYCQPPENARFDDVVASAQAGFPIFVTFGEVPTNATPTNATPTNATPTNETPTNETPTNATPTNETPTNETPTNMTVADVIRQNSDLSTLAFLTGIANLTDALTNDGPFTVFAPNNMAFLGVEPGTIADMDGLTRVLTYHVVAGEYPAEALLNMTAGNETTLETLAGVNLTLSEAEGGGLLVNGANLTTADIEADNGVVHIIDAVLIPPDDGGTPGGNET